MKPYFSGSSYITPEGKPRAIMDRLMLGGRWYFVGGYVNEMIRARSLANQGLYHKEQWAASSYVVFKLVEECGGRIFLQGLDNLKALREPVVFVSNHMSTLETFIFPCIIAPYLDVTFVVKESLVKHPLFGPVMRSRNPLVVKRVNPREDFETVMIKGKELLAQGVSIVIFPQSTRSVEFCPDEFNSLGIKLAKAAGVQVVPVAIKTDFWENGKVIKDVGPINRTKPIHVVFGQPFTVQGSGKEDHKMVIQFITDHLREWGGIIKE